FELGFEALLQREGVGRGAGEAGQYLVVIQAADFPGGALDDDVAQGDLAVAAQRNAVAAAHADDGGGVKLFHAFLPLKGLTKGEIADFKRAARVGLVRLSPRGRKKGRSGNTARP